MEKIIGIIIQARINSTRLPKKVIKKIEGKTILEHVILRLKKVKRGTLIILATTNKKEDDVLEKIAQKCKVAVYRGSEADVLDRFYQAAKLFNIDPIVRITADCPLIDPKIVEKVIKFYIGGNYDYVSNTHPVSYPDGQDVEVFSFKTLKKTWEKATSDFDREHVVDYILKNPNIFKMGNVANNKDISSIRITLDEKEDMALIKKIYKELYAKNQFFGMREMLQLFKQKPELIKINQHIPKTEGYL
jgi:spore coat polysaccharide biosynthesis protein SpsF (cytidylyltransferase family)